MEKKSAHYPLQEIKDVVAELGMACFTGSARQGVAALGLTPQEALDVIAGLSRREFVKSMTTLNDHRVWQDVYNCETPTAKAYVKFTLTKPTPENPTPRVVISFKEL